MDSSKEQLLEILVQIAPNRYIQAIVIVLIFFGLAKILDYIITQGFLSWRTPLTSWVILLFWIQENGEMSPALGSAAPACLPGMMLKSLSPIPLWEYQNQQWGRWSSWKISYSGPGRGSVWIQSGKSPWCFAGSGWKYPWCLKITRTQGSFQGIWKFQPGPRAVLLGQ